MDLMDMLQGQLSKGLIDQVTQHIGGAKPQQTQTATAGIFTLLTDALSRNASTVEGAGGLMNALEKDHDGSILNNLGGFLTGNDENVSNRASNGAGILGHILGAKQNNAIDMISKMSGMDKGGAASLMVKLAPVVLGALGKAKKEQNLDQNGLASLLMNTVQGQKKSDSNPTTSLITSFLDQDGDGSIVDDVASLGMKALGSFFGK